MIAPGKFPIEKFGEMETPFYFYDIALLRDTLSALRDELDATPDYCMHYAIKANANPRLLRVIAQYGVGADCVSGGEILRALEAGFPADKIVYAGVGKTDREINLGLEKGILCFNVESAEELAVINELAGQQGVKARVALRINPDVDAHTHAHITTGKAENKFGISMGDMDKVIDRARAMQNVEMIGLHFHIGSQILDMSYFVPLCHKINELQDKLAARGITIEYINVGGGLGIDYDAPDGNPIPDFKGYFDTYRNHLKLRPGQKLHFELGRAIVAQCGTLISKVVYVKKGEQKHFVILDAGMTDLIRPALYDAHHHIENITSTSDETAVYDVVGPICESSDVFGKGVVLPVTRRGDLIAIRSAGAYGEIMASQYNCRPLPESLCI